MWVLLALSVILLAACCERRRRRWRNDGERQEEPPAAATSPWGFPGTTSTRHGGPSFDEPAIQEALQACGAKYISTDAGSSAEQQLADVENLISQGANAIIILAQDGEAILPAVAERARPGHPGRGVRPADREPGLAVRHVRQRRDRASAKRRPSKRMVPKGNYVFIKGNSTDANADFLRSGQQEVLQDALDSGDIENVGESYTDNWDPAIAQTNMEQFLTDNNNDVDAVLAENDGMAGGVVAALEAQGLAGTVAVSGQDGDVAGLNRVALGTQTVDVCKDARELGKAAGESACAMAQGTALEDVADTQPFDSPGGNTMTSIFLTPQADHAGQPQHPARRGLDHPGGPVPGRGSRQRGGVRLAERRH